MATYENFFHEGEIFNISHEKNTITLEMCSAEMSQYDLRDPLELSKDNRLKGTLYFEEIQNIMLDDKTFTGKLRKTDLNCKILKFKIKENKAFFSIEWHDLRSGEKSHSSIEIKAWKVYWLCNPMLFC